MAERAVLILVRAGPAGSATAYYPARSGLKVLPQNVGEQPLPQLVLYPDGTLLRRRLPDPEQAGPQGRSPQEEQQQQGNGPLAVSAVQKDPFHYLAQKSHLGDRNDDHQEPDYDRCHQVRPGGRDLPEQTSIHSVTRPLRGGTPQRNATPLPRVRRAPGNARGARRSRRRFP